MALNPSLDHAERSDESRFKDFVKKMTSRPDSKVSEEFYYSAFDTDSSDSEQDNDKHRATEESHVSYLSDSAATPATTERKPSLKRPRSLPDIEQAAESKAKRARAWRRSMHALSGAISHGFMKPFYKHPVIYKRIIDVEVEVDDNGRPMTD